MELFLDEEKFNSNKNAVVFYDYERVAEVPYRRVYGISEILLKNIEIQKHTCLGLFMEHDICIPSIILWLQKIQCAFVFLNKRNCDRLIKELKLKFILSFTNVTVIYPFRKVKIVDIKDQHVILWKNTVEDDVVESFEGIFCVMESSGSTGMYKTIKIPIKCIEDNYLSLSKEFGINSSDVIFWGTPLTFDPSLIELLLAIENNATLMITPSKIFLNPNRLFRVMFERRIKITFLQMVPSLFFRWSETQIEKILTSPLRILAFGGEKFPAQILQAFKKTDLKIYNLYGITELSCWATVYKTQNENCDRVELGKVIGDTIVSVRNENGETITEGTGEIFLGSNTRYCILNGEKSTDFPIFRETGDIVEIIDNKMYFVGRKNNIIKRFGHKINLDVITDITLKVTSLKSVCLFIEKTNKLILFLELYTFEEYKKRLVIDKIRIKLLHHLPENMFPDFIDVVKKFPLNEHGKICKKSLEEIYINNEESKFIQNLFCKYLGISVENLQNFEQYNFFELGGNSITAIQLLLEINKIYDFNDFDENLFNTSIKNCLNNINLNKIRPVTPPTTETIKYKRIKSELEMSVKWKYDLRACVDSSPLVFKFENSTCVAVGSFSNIFVILNEIGEEIFKTRLPDVIESTPLQSPCGNFLFIGCFDGEMYCINIKEKKIQWKYKTGSMIKSTPCICNGNTTIVFGSYDKFVYCVRIVDGSLMWKTNANESISSNAIYDEHNKKIYLITLLGRCLCLSEKDGELMWAFRSRAASFGSPTLLDGNNIAFTNVQGGIICLSQHMEPIFNFMTEGQIFTSTFAYKNYLIVGCKNGILYNLDVSDKTYKIVFKTDIESSISTRPKIYECRDGKIVIVVCTNVGSVLLLDFLTGNVLCDISLNGETFSSPFVSENNIYVGCRDNNLYCLEIKNN